jgi:hypothetical protein
VDSNVIDSSDVQFEKHDLPRISTDAGISIVANELSANADSSIRCNFEADSNLIDLIDSQATKEYSHKTSILDSITTTLEPPK